MTLAESEYAVLDIMDDPESVHWLVKNPRALELMAISLQRELSLMETAELTCLTQGGLN